MISLKVLQQSTWSEIECGEKNRLCRSISKAMEYPWFFFHEAQDFPQALPTLVVTHFQMTVFRARFRARWRLLLVNFKAASN